MTSKTENPSQNNNVKKAANSYSVVTTKKQSPLKKWRRYIKRTRYALYFLVLFTLLIFAGAIYYGKNLLKTQQDLATQLAKQTAEFNQTLQAQSEKYDATLETLQQKIMSMAGDDGQSWVLSQADFYVKMAGRKLWSDQDTTTAIALLKTADNSLNELNDPSLLPVRDAIAADIAVIAKSDQIDIDALSLNLYQLVNQIDLLPFRAINKPLTPKELTLQSGVTVSTKDWRNNLANSWQDFMGQFIKVERRDVVVDPLMTSDQAFYIRANLRMQLLNIATAIPRHNNALYQSGLKEITPKISYYFDDSKNETQSVIKALNELIKQDISIALPSALNSQPLLNQLVKKRVRSLLAEAGETK